MAELKVNLGWYQLKKVFALIMVLCLCVTTIGMHVEAGDDSRSGGGLVVTPDKVSLEEGETCQLSVAVQTPGDGEQSPENGEQTPGNAEGYQWESKDPTIATVGENGLLTAVKAGNTTVTVTLGEKYGICEVTVTGEEEQTPEEGKEVTSLTLDGKVETMKVGDKHSTLSATVTPEDAKDRTIQWTSSADDIISVEPGSSQSGDKVTLTAKATGTATITATAAGAASGTTVSESFTVTVSEDEQPSGIKYVTDMVLTGTVTVMTIGDTHSTLQASITPADADNKEIAWTSDKSNVLSVTSTSQSGNNVTLIAKAEGEVTITAKAAGAAPEKPVVKSFKVVVSKRAVTSIGLNASSLSMKMGSNATLTATVNPSNATYNTVSWSVTKGADVVGVSGSGNSRTVTPKKNGTATIRATADGKYAECNVTVTTDPTGVSLAGKITIPKGSSKTLSANVLPATASNKAVTWTSDKNAVASVNSQGKVTAKAQGTAVITVKTANGKTAKCTVTVSEVKLNAASAALQLGKSTTAIKVAAKFPSSDKVKSWKSSNTKVASVNKNGKITASKTKTGKAVITLTMSSGAVAKCTITVQKGAVTTKKLSLNVKKLTLQKGKKATLTATRNPITATEKITWSTSNSKVATVNSKGQVTAKGFGKATITARTANKKTIKCTITVPVPKVTLKASSATLSLKNKKTVTIAIKSKTFSTDTVASYKSSNTKIVTVDKKGKVTAKKAGKANITVKMKSGATATFKVTVKK